MSDWSRRTFLQRSALGLGGALLASLSPQALLALHQEAQTAAASGEAFRFLSLDEAADVRAFAAQVIPADDTPGAEEAHVVYFIDRALAELDTESQPAFRHALTELNELAGKESSPSQRFAALAPAPQRKVIAALEKLPSPPRSDMMGAFYGIGTSSFDVLRSFVLAGFLSVPELGGNKDAIGWKLIGFDGLPIHQPPFGYYDAELLKNTEPKA